MSTHHRIPSVRARRGPVVPAALVGSIALCLAALAPAGAAALPLISEVLYDAVGSDDGRIFVELSGTPGESLDGYTLEGVNGSNGAVGPVILLSGVIGDDGLFVVADQTSGGTTEIPFADLLASFDFQNGPDSIVLTDGLSTIDAIGYGVFAAGEVFAGEGSAAEDPAAGSSLARVFADLDTDDNAVDFVVLDVPTPGSAEFLPVPEPGTGLLAGVALATLAWLRRSPLGRAAVDGRT